MNLGVPLGVYVPGKTLVHRLSAGPKIVGLIVFIIAVVSIARTLPAALFTAAISVTGFLLARIPARTAAGQVLPAVPIVAFFAAFQLWQVDLTAAGVLFFSLMSTIAAATLLTLTTRLADILESVEKGLRPFERLGVPAETISLAMSLTLRMIPLQLATLREVLDARAARGAGFSFSAVGIPVIVRAVRRARALSEALIARGVGD